MLCRRMICGNRPSEATQAITLHGYSQHWVELRGSVNSVIVRKFKPPCGRSVYKALFGLRRRRRHASVTSRHACLRFRVLARGRGR